MNDLTKVVVAVPSVLLVLSATAGATAQITLADKDAVRRAVYVTSAVLLAAAAVTQDVATVVSTAVAIGATVYLVTKVWL